MIITSNKIGMNSQREYSKSLSHSSKTSRHAQGSLFADVTMQSLEENYSSKEQYDSYSAYNAPESENLQGSFIYSDFKSSNYQIKADSSNYKLNAATGAVTANNTASVTSTYADFRREAFYSLIDLIRNLKLRNLFEYPNDSFCDSYSSYDAGYQSQLVMSNSPNTILWTVTSDYSSVFTEKETTTFSTTGNVTTADGRSIDFNLNLEMSREYMEQNDLSFVNQYTSILTDPLVINLTDAPASISDQTFLFDIDGDGQKEEHASLNSNSGFLALDRNNDGIINDGTELFGTKSGNGFKDLSAYDTDGNGWIDEADDIFKDLKVWTRDDNGNDTLLSLKDANVGAIYLGSSQSDFAVTNENNEVKAKVRQTGVYLHEDGSAGSIQQLDI